MPLITLLTDFGTADGYVAELKAVLATEAPGAAVVDATHDIPPQDVEAARLALMLRGLPGLRALDAAQVDDLLATFG